MFIRVCVCKDYLVTMVTHMHVESKSEEQCVVVISCMYLSSCSVTKNKWTVIWKELVNRIWTRTERVAHLFFLWVLSSSHLDFVCLPYWVFGLLDHLIWHKGVPGCSSEGRWLKDYFTAGQMVSSQNWTELYDRKEQRKAAVLFSGPQRSCWWVTVLQVGWCFGFQAMAACSQTHTAAQHETTRNKQSSTRILGFKRLCWAFHFRIFVRTVWNIKSLGSLASVQLFCHLPQIFHSPLLLDPLLFIPHSSSSAVCVCVDDRVVVMYNAWAVWWNACTVNSSFMCIFSLLCASEALWLDIVTIS